MLLGAFSCDQRPQPSCLPACPVLFYFVSFNLQVRLHLARVVSRFSLPHPSIGPSFVPSGFAHRLLPLGCAFYRAYHVPPRPTFPASHCVAALVAYSTFVLLLFFKIEGLAGPLGRVGVLGFLSLFCLGHDHVGRPS